MIDLMNLSRFLSSTQVYTGRHAAVNQAFHADPNECAIAAVENERGRKVRVKTNSKFKHRANSKTKTKMLSFPGMKLASNSWITKPKNNEAWRCIENDKIEFE